MTATNAPCFKVRYRSRRAAEDTLSAIWARVKPGRRLETRAYKCPCGWWHLTSKPARTPADA